MNVHIRYFQLLLSLLAHMLQILCEFLSEISTKQTLCTYIICHFYCIFFILKCVSPTFSAPPNLKFVIILRMIDDTQCKHLAIKFSMIKITIQL